MKRCQPSHQRFVATIILAESVSIAPNNEATRTVAPKAPMMNGAIVNVAPMGTQELTEPTLIPSRRV